MEKLGHVVEIKKDEQNNGNQKKMSTISFQVNSSAVIPWFISHAIGLYTHRQEDEIWN